MNNPVSEGPFANPAPDARRLRLGSRSDEAN